MVNFERRKATGNRARGVTAVEFILMAGIAVFLAVLIVNFTVKSIFNPTLNSSNNTVTGVNERSACFFVNCNDQCDPNLPNVRQHSAICENGQCTYRGSETCSAGCLNGVCLVAPLEVGFTYTNAGMTYTFTSSASFSQGSIVQRIWNFGDGNTTTTNSLTMAHTYSATGTYTVTHTAVDNTGRQNSTQQELTVS